MTRLMLEVKTFEGREFFYVDVGKETHGHPSFRLWVHHSLVKKDSEGNPYIEIPAQNVKIIRTEKGTVVLRRAEGWNVFLIGIPCGYRGESWFEIMEPSIADADIFPYKVYDSEVGSLGISTYALVNIRTDKIKIKWGRKHTGILLSGCGSTTALLRRIQKAIHTLKFLL